MTAMPVRPELLVWARKYRGLSVGEAAKLLDMEVDELGALESGAEPLMLTPYRKISTRYRIPGATLLRRTPPVVPAMPRDFRTVGGRAARIGFETRLAIDYARTIEANIIELSETILGRATPVLPRIDMREDAAEAGERERERIGVPSINQLAWKSSDTFNNWRAIIERAGCYVLFQNIDLKECKGFALCDDANVPIIMISKKEPLDTARTFTLIHEYSHLLLRAPGISDQRNENAIEAFCNRFAAGFLIPRTALRALLPYWPNTPADWDMDSICEWAAQLKVSQRTLALRLEEMNLAPSGFFGRVVASQRHVDKKQTTGGNYVNTQMFEMGNRYLRAVFVAVDRKEIGRAEAVDMTNLGPQHFEYVRDQVEQKFERIGTAAFVPH